jgi:SAM-dependent methyltransferase
MPSVAENLGMWDRTYDWSRGGEEWGDPQTIWRDEALVYMDGFSWHGTTLEIAPGFGRFTQFLLPLSRRLILVDLAPKCIAACRDRFGSAAEYHVNDGTDLSFVDANSIDVAFSHSSLVHAEQDVMDAYIAQLATMLRPGGRGLLHHSRLADMDFDGYNQYFAGTVGPTTVAASLDGAGLDVIGQFTTTHLDAAPIGCVTTFRRPEWATAS